MARSFLGGTHPHDQKKLSDKKEISTMEQAPDYVVLPMRQHIGAPCQPTVQIGDAVRIGDKVGEPVGLGAPVHASISGKVVKVEERPHVSGERTMAVVIESDGQNAIAPRQKPKDPASLSPEQLIDVIKEAGITGLGGAGFPTHAKLSSARGKVDTILVNAAECEPYITCDHRILMEQHDEVIAGLRIVMQILELDKAHIGIEANKANAVRLLEAHFPLRGGDIQVHVLRTRYPQGAEKQLIDAIVGREVPPGGLPSDVGCVVFNVSTIYAIYQAVVLGMPLTHRVVTLTGHGLHRTRNVLVPIGTPLRHLLEEAGGMREECSLLIFGGPMMGVPQFDLDASLTKGNNCLLALTDQERKPPAPQDNPCIRCGKCVLACPMRLQPVNIHLYASRRALREAERLNIMDCYECGACSFVCPAKIALTQSFRTTKAEILRQRRIEQAKKEEASK